MREPVDETRTTELEAHLEKARNKYETFQTELYSAHPELKIIQAIDVVFKGMRERLGITVK